MKAHHKTRPRFKVLPLDWGYDFHFDMFFDLGKDKWTEEECYKYELDLYDKEGDDYDGPLRYLERCSPFQEECLNKTFPKRKGIMYCVRDLFNGYQNPNVVWKPYTCYCYQVGMWWKFKQPQTIFTDLYVPRMSQYEFDKLTTHSNRYNYMGLIVPYEYLNEKAKMDVQYYRHAAELRNISRSMAKHFLRIDKDDNPE